MFIFIATFKNMVFKFVGERVVVTRSYMIIYSVKNLLFYQCITCFALTRLTQ